MSPSHSVLGRAFAVSLLLHALLIAAGGRLAPSPRSDRQMESTLSVLLREKPAPPQLILPEVQPVQSATAPPRHAAPEPRSRAAPRGFDAVRLSGEAASAAQQQLSQELLYPLEAVQRGLEGDATVLVFLDTAGNVVAARLEASSGHRILDDAALHAARMLRSLPASAPREALVPVRFRLR